MTTEPADQLSLAIDATGRLVAAVGDDQWALSTPCTDWTVRDLVNHLIVGQYRFASILRGEPPLAAEDIVTDNADMLHMYRESAAALLDAFRQPGVLERTVTVPFGTVPGLVALHLRVTESLVHGWDLARATGQADDFPDDVAEAELVFSRAHLGNVPPPVPPRRSPFAPPQAIADDAPAIDRLAALLGRRVDSVGPAAR